MKDSVRAAFERTIQRLPLTAILPLRVVPPAVKASPKYQQITTSMATVGVIEPLVVARTNDSKRYLLLDGHLRYAILLASGESDARCVIAKDDEGFTYNKRINRLATIQEHLMIVRAIARGVPEDRLAKALNLDISAIRRRRTMLVGISPEVIDLLKDKTVNAATFGTLRRMRPMRQIEAAELMTAAGNYSASYARALLAATRQADMVAADQPKKVAGLTAEQMAKMEREMESLQQDVKSVEARYGDDVLHLVIASAYLAKLVANAAIKRYLEHHHPELLPEILTIIAAASIDPAPV